MRCSQPSISNIEKDFVNDALSKGDIGVGSYIENFEKGWANINGMKYGVACNSGTNAIYLALKTLGIGKGDEVIVPEFTMIASAWAVSYTGATPVFVDCKDDLTIDDSKIKISKKTKAIIPTAIYGRPATILDYGIPIVEDLAEGHGIQVKGDIACYSFYGNKIITTGEGGMCLTNDKKLADEIRLLANMYFDKGRTMIHPKIGHNFRMTNLQAAFGCGQLERFKWLLEKRQQIATWYDKYLDKSFLMPKREVVWMYDINCGYKRDKIKNYLEERGIESRYFFKPMSMQPMYKGEYKHLNAYKWSKQGLYLPTYPDMTEEDVKMISLLVNRFV